MLSYSRQTCLPCPENHFCEGGAHKQKCDQFGNAASAPGAATFAACTALAGYYLNADGARFLACGP
eukprot:1587827-Rhodomonas_salina.1